MSRSIARRGSARIGGSRTTECGYDADWPGLPADSPDGCELTVKEFLELFERVPEVVEKETLPSAEDIIAIITAILPLLGYIIGAADLGPAVREAIAKLGIAVSP